MRGLRNVTHIEDAEKKQSCPGAVWLYLTVSLWALCREHRETFQESRNPPLPSTQPCWIPGTLTDVLEDVSSSPFDAHNSILQPLPRTARETQEGWSSFYWETFYPLPAAGSCFTVCASLISDTSCCVAPYLLKLFWFVLVLSLSAYGLCRGRLC